MDTHWIVTLLQARSEVRTGQGRTQKAGQVTTVPVVFAELRPGLRHGDKDDPTLPLPMWLHSVGPSFPSPTQLILFSVFDTQITVSRKPLFFPSFCPWPCFLHMDILVSSLDHCLSMIPFGGRTPVTRVSFLFLPLFFSGWGVLCASFFLCQTCRMELPLPHETVVNVWCGCHQYMTYINSIHESSFSSL